MTPRIHTFGDSHSLHGWNDNIIKHHIGPVLCYSFGKDNLKKLDISNYDIMDGDYVIFCFGEIDCRCHIHKHISVDTTYTKIIDNLTELYFDAIRINIDKIQINVRVCVYNVVPPVLKNAIKNDPKYPLTGSDEDRKRYVEYFNNCLNKYCLKHNYIYFDIYDHYIDNKGFLKKELSDGSVHLKNTNVHQKFIESLFHLYGKKY